jgi:hypothetical protein
MLNKELAMLGAQGQVTIIARNDSNPLYIYVFKYVHAVTSIKQSPVLKGEPFSCPVMENFI